MSDTKGQIRLNVETDDAQLLSDATAGVRMNFDLDLTTAVPRTTGGTTYVCFKQDGAIVLRPYWKEEVVASVDDGLLELLAPAFLSEPGVKLLCLEDRTSLLVFVSPSKDRERLTEIVREALVSSHDIILVNEQGRTQLN